MCIRVVRMAFFYGQGAKKNTCVWTFGDYRDNRIVESVFCYGCLLTDLDAVIKTM